MNSVERLLWWLLAGSVGGINRGRILTELMEIPQNANNLAKATLLDYKTVKHHVEVLEKNRLITSTGSGYGKMYFPSELLNQNMEYFTKIWDKIGKNKINKEQNKGA